MENKLYMIVNSQNLTICVNSGELTLPLQTIGNEIF